MEFRSLRLVGFKSFAEPVELTLPPGLTGIVGPNGCGKSNLTEGLRWAMGEGSARGLRADGMDEVIFAGARGRPARGFAEVTLGLWRDGDEIAVTRRIVRGEGSVYRLNGGPARARDVHLLFADAATGAHAAALVGQGRVASVISAKPTDRRQMLEEAAGIAGLAVRRKEAEQRLRAAAANLERVVDVAAEIDAQVAGLKRQARAAERYAELSTKVRVAEARLLHAAHADADARARSAAARALACDASVTEVAGAIGACVGARASVLTVVARARDAEAAARAETERLRQIVDTLAETRMRAERRLAEARAQADALGRDLARARADHDEAQAMAARAAEALQQVVDGEPARAAALARARAEAVAASTALAAVEAALGHAMEMRADAVAQRRVADDASRAARAAHVKRTQNLAAAERAMAALGPGPEPETQPEPADGISATGPANPDPRSREMDEIAVMEATVRSDRDSLAVAAATCDGARAARERAEVVRAEHAPRLAAARATLAALAAEGAALRRSVEGGGGNGGGASAAARITVKPGYEAALAAALGTDLTAMIGVAGKGWAAAGAGDADAALPDGAVPLIDRVIAPPELARRLAQVGVVEDDRQGGVLAPRLAPGQRLVSRGGALWRWDGFELARAGDGAAAERLRAINRLADVDLATAAATVEADAAMLIVAEADAVCLAAASLAHEAATKLVAAERARDESVARLERARAEAAARSARAVADARAAGERSAAAADRARALAIEHAGRCVSLGADVVRLADECRAAAADERAAEVRLAGLRAPDVVNAELQAARHAADAARAARDRAAARAATTEASTADAARAHALAEHSLADWRGRAAQAGSRMDELTARAAASDRSLVEARDDLPEDAQAAFARAASARAAAVGSTDQAACARRDAEAALTRADAEIAALTERGAAAREERAAANVEAGHAAHARAEIVRVVLDRFQCEPALLPGRLDFVPDAAPVGDHEAELDRLKRERERLGPVNLRALQELVDASGRAATLGTERAEVETACNRLRGSIGALNRDGRARLTETFEKVAVRFATLFQTLFGGGEARLALIDADDPLDAGLEIYAKPPGKAAQSLALLSGGEQALTAVALLFAFFLENPAPICVLDEVDAPLDDANVERFCDLLREVAKASPTRFLVVTHNPVTMASMDRLYGVTMAEPGVSQVVSVDLAAAEALLAA